MEAAAFDRRLDEANSEFSALLYRYTHALFNQLKQHVELQPVAAAQHTRAC